MRGIVLFTATFALIASSLADGWLLKAPYEANKKLTWKVTVNVNMGGQEHEATMKQSLTIETQTDKEIKAKAMWAELSVDGNEVADSNPDGWKITLNPNGSISAADDGADIARMIAPAAFVYPGKEVKTGDKWSVKYKPAKDSKELTADYEVMEETKVGDTAALKVKGTVSEDGPLKCDAIYWLGKDGNVLKYELTVKGYVVPMVPGEMDAKIKGELVKG